MLEVIEGRARAARWRGAMFAGLLMLLAALGAVNASGASALGEQCSGSNAQGLGAFLQTQAQQRWSSKGEQGFNGSANSLACSGSQGSGGTPSVVYTPLGSAGALRTWGAQDGVLHTGEFEGTYHFLGTDIAPSGPVGEAGTMLANMKKALGSDVAVVPVTQTAIAIAAHPPTLPAHSPCLMPKITPVQLQKVFSGEIKNWRQIGTASDSSIGGRLRPVDHPDRPGRKCWDHLPVQALPQLRQRRAARLHRQRKTNLGTAPGSLRRRNVPQRGMAAQQRLPGR